MRKMLLAAAILPLTASPLLAQTMCEKFSVAARSSVADSTKLAEYLGQDRREVAKSVFSLEGITTEGTEGTASFCSGVVSIDVGEFKRLEAARLKPGQGDFLAAMTGGLATVKVQMALTVFAMKPRGLPLEYKVWSTDAGKYYLKLLNDPVMDHLCEIGDAMCE